MVAHAMSRQQINALSQQDKKSFVAMAHTELFLTYTIETTEKPFKCFQNQKALAKASFPS